MKKSQLERYIKQAIKEAMYIDSQGNLHSDDDKIKRAGEDKDQLIYHKGEKINQRAFFDDKINGRKVEGFWIGPQGSWGDHGRQFYVWDPELARGGHVLGSFTINSNRGNLDSHISVDQNPTKITHGRAKGIIEDIKKEVLRRISDGTLEETMSGVPTHADEFDDSSSQDDIGVNSGGDMGTHSGISQLEEDNKEIVQYEGKAHTIEGGGADRYKIKLVNPNQTTRLNGELPFWVRKDEVTKKTNEISALESYIKEAINGYLNGSPWSHGIAVGHKVNKYNDPELIRKRYDKAAANNFERRPKGRLSTPRGYSLNESCNCGCGGCETPEPEHQSLRQYIQDYITESDLDWHQNAYNEYKKAQEDLKTAEQEMRQAKQVWKADHTNDQLRYDYQDAIGKFKNAEKQVWMKQSLLPK
jgi:hypothetical protein